jgi:2-oxoglutarate dehydrogenase complex dehydrogenase (E1) component-like enzyme
MTRKHVVENANMERLEQARTLMDKNEFDAAQAIVHEISGSLRQIAQGELDQARVKLSDTEKKSKGPKHRGVRRDVEMFGLMETKLQAEDFKGAEECVQCMPEGLTRNEAVQRIAEARAALERKNRKFNLDIPDTSY